MTVTDGQRLKLLELLTEEIKTAKREISFISSPIRSGALCSIVPWLSQCWLLLLSDPGCRAILQFATLPLLVLSVSAIGGILTPSIDYLAYNSRHATGTYSACYRIRFWFVEYFSTFSGSIRDILQIDFRLDA